MTKLNEYSVFYDSGSAESYPITELDLHEVIKNNDYKSFNQNAYYLVDNEYVYKYIGRVYKLSEVSEGEIYLKDNVLSYKMYKDKSLIARFSSSNIYDTRDNRPTETINVEDIIDSYVESYNNEENIMATNKDILVNAGNIFIPTIKEDDDPLTYLVKSMIIKKEINLSDYKSNYDKSQEHLLNNMRSALIGTTKTTSINYFLEWCKIMGLDWYIRVWDNGVDDLFPMEEELVISNNCPLHEEASDDYPKQALKPILIEGEDPLKRIIKVAILRKKPITKEYKTKCPSDFTLTNMSSSLKGPTKMTITYFRSWCEILGLHWSILVKDEEHGTISVDTIE